MHRQRKDAHALTEVPGRGQALSVQHRQNRLPLAMLDVGAVQHGQHDVVERVRVRVQDDAAVLQRSSTGIVRMKAPRTMR
jgi:hypothetical protein